MDVNITLSKKALFAVFILASTYKKTQIKKARIITSRRAEKTLGEHMFEVAGDSFLRALTKDQKKDGPPADVETKDEEHPDFPSDFESPVQPQVIPEQRSGPSRPSASDFD